MTIPQRILTAQVDWAGLQPSEFTYVPCNICGSFAHRILASVVINCAEFFLVQCSDCGLIWRNPLPGSTFLRTLYTERYYQAQGYPPDISDQVGIADTEVAAKEFREEISQKVVQSWIDFGVTPRDESGHSRRYLEIGGGRGYLQQVAAAKGWNTMGLEISPHGIREAIGRQLVVLPVVLDELCTRYIPYDRDFDLIVFYDYLEHVDDPSRVLRMIHSILADDGNIIFRVPNTSACPRLHLIDHIWHFSTATLPAILQKEGFEVLHGHHSGTYHARNGNAIENITVFAKKSGEAVRPTQDIVLGPNPLGL